MSEKTEQMADRMIVKLIDFIAVNGINPSDEAIDTLFEQCATPMVIMKMLGYDISIVVKTAENLSKILESALNKYAEAEKREKVKKDEQ